jgi:hypothetical protein
MRRLRKGSASSIGERGPHIQGFPRFDIFAIAYHDDQRFRPAIDHDGVGIAGHQRQPRRFSAGGAFIPALEPLWAGNVIRYCLN